VVLPSKETKDLFSVEAPNQYGILGIVSRRGIAAWWKGRGTIACLPSLDRPSSIHERGLEDTIGTSKERTTLLLTPRFRSESTSVFSTARMDIL